MKRLLWVCALLGLFAAGCGSSTPTNTNKPASTPTPSGSSITTSSPGGDDSKDDDEEEEGDVTGAYFPAGQLPAEFGDIEHLSLATVDAEGNAADLNGFIRPKERA